LKDKIRKNLKQPKGNTAGKYIFLAVAVIILDQLLKYVAVSSGEFIKNTGIIFGFFENANTVMIYVSIIAWAILLAVLLFSNVRFKFFYALILGGVIGNMTDRIMRGYVVDWIHIDIFGLWRFPSFNIADAAISGSVIVIVLLNYWHDTRKKPAKAKKKEKVKAKQA
jgi:signal peptidase II